MLGIVAALVHTGQTFLTAAFTFSKLGLNVIELRITCFPVAAHCIAEAIHEVPQFCLPHLTQWQGSFCWNSLSDQQAIFIKTV